LEQVVTQDEKGYMDIDLRKEEFVLMVTKADRLLLLQAYQYATPGDVLYYLLKACHHFLLDQNEVTVRLSGLIDINSSLYNELYQYFINIGFREATWQAPPADLPAHFFTSLNDLARCE
jgi:hypothetical protein